MKRNALQRSIAELRPTRRPDRLRCARCQSISTPSVPQVPRGGRLAKILRDSIKVIRSAHCCAPEDTLIFLIGDRTHPSLSIHAILPLTSYRRLLFEGGCLRTKRGFHHLARDISSVRRSKCPMRREDLTTDIDEVAGRSMAIDPILGCWESETSSFDRAWTGKGDVAGRHPPSLFSALRWTASLMMIRHSRASQLSRHRSRQFTSSRIAIRCRHCRRRN